MTRDMNIDDAPPSADAPRGGTATAGSIARTISAIIPAWCEARELPGAVRAASAIADEVIVVDARSPDSSAKIAAAAGASVIVSERGRGRQLAAGARAAVGDVLLFVHADARLPPTARTAIEAALTDSSVAGGNFRLRFEPSTRWGSVFARADNLRRRWLRIYYGDSGLFVRRDIYEALGGFRDLPILEDHDFARRLEQAARTVYLANVEITASSRRFLEAPLRTLAIWTLIQSLASAGISPVRLARLYADIR